MEGKIVHKSCYCIASLKIFYLKFKANVTLTLVMLNARYTYSTHLEYSKTYHSFLGHSSGTGQKVFAVSQFIETDSLAFCV